MLRRSATRRRRPLATSLYDRQTPTAAALRGTLHLLYVGGTGQDAPRIWTASACCWINQTVFIGGPKFPYIRYGRSVALTLNINTVYYVRIGYRYFSRISQIEVGPVLYQSACV